ncbi:SDR family oxidoreductase [Saccharopolyspora elongata]|uniref:SDR family oxidoreductase n=1 Tax=Saccharopolyspora elongata TaxID=2530387 RepID=UPI0038B617A5
MEPAEVAAAIAFRASPEASGITGRTLLVDGGLTARLAVWSGVVLLRTCGVSGSASSIEIEPSISMELAVLRCVGPRHAGGCGQLPQFQWKSDLRFPLKLHTPQVTGG